MKKNIDQQKQTRKCGNRISRQGRTTFTATILHVFKELKGRLSMLSSDTKNILKTHIKLLDVETTMSQIKSIPNGNHRRLGTADVDISRLEETTETIQNKPQSEKKTGGKRE